MTGQLGGYGKKAGTVRQKARILPLEMEKLLSFGTDLVPSIVTIAY